MSTIQSQQREGLEAAIEKLQGQLDGLLNRINTVTAGSQLATISDLFAQKEQELVNCKAQLAILNA